MVQPHHMIPEIEVVIVVVHRHRDCWYHEHARLLLLIRLHWHSLRHHWLNGLHLLLHLHLLHLHWLHPNDSPLCWLLWLLVRKILGFEQDLECHCTLVEQGCHECGGARVP